MQDKAPRVPWQCPYWHVEERQFTGKDGSERTWYSAHRPNRNTVHILAITPDGLVPLLRQWRPPLEEWVWELPAGVCDVPGENLEETAHRELAEESGWQAEEMMHLFSGTVSPGLTDEMYHAFLAINLTHVSDGGGNAGEQIEVRLVPFTQLLMFVQEAARVGDLVDSKIITHITLTLGKLEEMTRLAGNDNEIEPQE